jgi:phospho-N-acetylmuramoyl-pentapeptide-transferase
VFYYLTQLTGACRYCGVFNVFSYITFRSAGAAVTAMLIAFMIGPAAIRRLRAMKVNQGVREGTPDSHQTKGQTPTMGGVIILASGLVPVLLWARLNNRYIWTAIAVTAWMGAIGFLDDYLKLRQQREGKKNRGLIERYKLAGQVAIGIALGACSWCRSSHGCTCRGWRSCSPA